MFNIRLLLLRLMMLGNLRNQKALSLEQRNQQANEGVIQWTSNRLKE